MFTITENELSNMFCDYIDASKYIESFLIEPAATTIEILQDVGTGNDYFIKASHKNDIKNKIIEFAKEKAEQVVWDDAKDVKSAIAIKKLKNFIPYFEDKGMEPVMQISSYDKKFAEAVGVDLPPYGKASMKQMQKWFGHRSAAMKLLKEYGVISKLTEGVPGIVASIFAVNIDKLNEIKTLSENIADDIENLEGEEWRTTLVSNSYQVSNWGRVKSLNYRNTGTVALLKPIYNTYFDPVLKVGISGKQMSIHRLVYEAFNGPTTDTTFFIHKDFDPMNCRLDNLIAIDNEATAELQLIKDIAGEKQRQFWSNYKK